MILFENFALVNFFLDLDKKIYSNSCEVNESTPEASILVRDTINFVVYRASKVIEYYATLEEWKICCSSVTLATRAKRGLQ